MYGSLLRHTAWLCVQKTGVAVGMAKAKAEGGGGGGSGGLF